VRALERRARQVKENLGHWGREGHKKGEKPDRCASLGREMQKRQVVDSLEVVHSMCQQRQDNILLQLIK
jgi:hypothetical protein